MCSVYVYGALHMCMYYMLVGVHVCVYVYVCRTYLSKDFILSHSIHIVTNNYMQV